MLDELNTLALLRARDQARALLATARNAMIEVERPARYALVALLADGHLLLEDVPGVGKTTLARIIARTIGGHDSRIQCTADLSPRDVIGRRSVGQPALRPQPFDPGPLFANAVVMDEINRATPMLQSALFEAMEERFVTRRQEAPPAAAPVLRRRDDEPARVEEEMYHLPFGQRDRFALCTGIGYPSANGEFDLLSRFGRYDALADIDPIVAPGDIVKVQRSVTLVEMPDEIREYLVTMVRETRTHPGVAVGASPRAALSLQRCCQALALLEDSASVVPRPPAGALRRLPRPPHPDPRRPRPEGRVPGDRGQGARAGVGGEAGGDARRRPRHARGQQRRPAGRLPPRAPLRERLIRRRRARSPGPAGPGRRRPCGPPGRRAA